MTTEALPPFHLPGTGDQSDLYAVAFVAGQYVAPGGSPDEPCFSVIYFRHASAKRPFCVMSINGSGYVFSRANREVTNIDQVLLTVWEMDRIYPANWTLYCEMAEDAAAQIIAPATRRAYQKVARQAAETIRLLYICRFAREAGEAEARKRGRTLEPLFRFEVGRQQSALQLLDRFTEPGVEPPFS